MMNTLVLPHWLAARQFKVAYKRLLLPVFLFALLVAEPTRALTVNALADSFWAVSCYVVVTLAIYHHASSWFKRQHFLTRLYHQDARYQIFFASLLGALPGCGGAIIVTTQFVRGQVRFASVVAVLTSTMGDAAFLLLANQPKMGLLVISLGVLVGFISGLLVDLIHQPDFLRQKLDVSDSAIGNCCEAEVEHGKVEKKAINLQGVFWKWLLLPCALVAFVNSFQIDLDNLLSLPPQTMAWFGASFAIICLLLWSLAKDIRDYESTVSEDQKLQASHPIQRAAQDSNFISAWVIMAFIVFELLNEFSGLDLAQALVGWGALLPLAAVGVGLLPGCGPQILVTSLYIAGNIPFSAQLANAISNDGDALFPAIAMAPKAALLATIYSAIPALLVGYSCYFWFEI